MRIYHIAFVILLCITSAYAQNERSTSLTSRSAKSFKGDPYYRMQRIWYQRRLGIDSLSAQQLIEADEARENAIRAVFADLSVDISTRARIQADAKSAYQQTLRAILDDHQISVLAGRSSANLKKGSSALHIQAADSTTTQSRMLKVYDMYQKRISALYGQPASDSIAQKQEIRRLVKERNSKVDAVLEEQAVKRAQRQKDQMLKHKLTSDKKLGMSIKDSTGL